jgi:hypothetical protein
MTKKEKIGILKTMPKYTLITDGKQFDFINDYFKNHPDYLDKTSGGLKGYIYDLNNAHFKKTHCFYIVNNAGEKIDISYNFTDKKCNDADEKKEVLKAMRTTIEFIVEEKRKEFVYNKTKCEISGQTIGDISNCHIDHYNYDFRDVAERFLKHYNKTYSDLAQYVIDTNSKRSFNNEILNKAFIEFHNSNTNLRFTTKEQNLKRKKS